MGRRKAEQIVAEAVVPTEIVEEAIEEMEAEHEDMAIVERANRVSIAVDEDGLFVARWYRTHKYLGASRQGDIAWTPSNNHNRTQQRESFRRAVEESALLLGYNYDPTDRRAEENIVPSRYMDSDTVTNTAYKWAYNQIAQILEDTNDLGIEGLLWDITESTFRPLDTYKDRPVQSTYKDGAIAYGECIITVAIERADCRVVNALDLTYRIVSGQLSKAKVTKTMVRQAFQEAISAE